jgi:hypothetical protein
MPTMEMETEAVDEVFDLDLRVVTEGTAMPGEVNAYSDNCPTLAVCSLLVCSIGGIC